MKHYPCDHDTGRAKLVINGRLTCPDCQYEVEYGPVQHGPPAELPRSMKLAPPQEERLFPLPPPVPKEVRRGS